MEKNRVRVTICGTDYVISSENAEEYMLEIGEKVNSKMQQMLDSNSRLSVSMAAVLAAMDYCDEAVKSEKTADNLRSQIKKYLDDSSQAYAQAEDSKREIERMNREIQRLRLRLAEDDNSAYGSAAKKASQGLKQEPEAPISKPNEEPDNMQTSFFADSKPSYTSDDVTDDIMKFFNEQNGENF